ncbi:DedA family protein [Clostridium sardiniense]|uniref:DedA family protein n=1 Tax=Clostridium sardiniense TaxID=29369 RepID=A0ABS7L1I3_CLOSR|nr:DedA family protein [Clostridium sardiniense]MBY0756926.1 DedA family protein [Clostridium sardiniense]MDQ0458773.1 membrane protein DedA with SNARE-associated domain [Clostridium sardiniense]
MEIEIILDYFSQYGLTFLFVIVFLEYLNLPGLPAGIIMPAVGVLIANGESNFFVAIIISVIAGVLGSVSLYIIGRVGGAKLLDKYLKKFPKQKKYVDKIEKIVEEKGNFGVFISKLIPVARTLVSIPAGVFKLNFVSFVAYSALGIFFWNTAFISAGYFLGDIILFR